MANERAIEIYRQLARELPTYREELVEKLTSLADVLAEAGRLGEARACLEEAVEVARRIAHPHLTDLRAILDGVATLLGPRDATAD